MKETKRNKVLFLFTHPRRLFASFIAHTPRLWSDEFVIRYNFRMKMGYPLNLKNPQTFSEKLQWLKLYNRRPEFTTMVDKYAVKEYVASIIGKDYIIPTLNIWNRVEDIEWEKLPKKFVLKCTHDSGGLVICHDKEKLNKAVAIAKLRKSLKNNYYYQNREWPYKDVMPRIIAEQYLEPDSKTNDLRDYKFFCFNGKVKCFKIDFNRQVDHHANYYTPEGKLLPFGEKVFPPIPNKELEIPASLPQMIVLAEKIAERQSFLRVDFYDHFGKIYFGEITFFPASGTGRFTNDEWDEELGSWVTLPTNPL